MDAHVGEDKKHGSQFHHQLQVKHQASVKNTSATHLNIIRSSSRGLLSFKKSKSRFLFRFEPFHDCNQDPRQILFLASSWIYSLVFPGSLI